jgi:hypothetical protein
MRALFTLSAKTLGALVINAVTFSLEEVLQSRREALAKTFHLQGVIDILAIPSICPPANALWVRGCWSVCWSIGGVGRSSGRLGYALHSVLVCSEWCLGQGNLRQSAFSRLWRTAAKECRGSCFLTFLASRAVHSGVHSACIQVHSDRNTCIQLLGVLKHTVFIGSATMAAGGKCPFY